MVVIFLVWAGVIGKGAIDEVKNAKAISQADSAYVGTWKSSDGTTIVIRQDGTGDYETGTTKVNPVVVTIDDGAKTLEMKLATFKKKWTITAPPAGGHLSLDGVDFSSGGGGSGGSSSGGASDSGSAGGNSGGANSGGTSGSAPAADGKPDQATANQIAKASLVLFKSAVDTEDFQAFYEVSASNLHSEHTPETIKTAFKVFLDNKALLEPIGSMEPSVENINITSEGHLELVGSYPSSPALKFELVYFSEDGVWKIAGIKVNRTA